MDASYHEAAAAKKAAKEWLASLPAGAAAAADDPNPNVPEDRKDWAAAVKRRLVGFGVVFLGAKVRGGGGDDDGEGRVDEGVVVGREQAVYLFRADPTTAAGAGGQLPVDSPATAALRDVLAESRRQPLVLHHAQTVVGGGASWVLFDPYGSKGARFQIVNGMR